MLYRVCEIHDSQILEEGAGKVPRLPRRTARGVVGASDIRCKRKSFLEAIEEANRSKLDLRYIISMTTFSIISSNMPTVGSEGARPSLMWGLLALLSHGVAPSQLARPRFALI